MNKELLKKEIERIVEETMMDCSDLERTVASIIAAQMFMTAPPMPTKVLRLVHEILHKYYSMMEGLEKK